MQHATRTPLAPQDLLKQGFALLNQGRPQEAARLCQQVIAQNPRIPQAHFLVGLVALSLRDRLTAVQAFGSVTQLQPDHAAAWAQLAKLFIEEGQVNRADQALKEAEKHGSSDPLVQDLLGTVYTRMGDHGRAKVQFEQAVAGASEQPQYSLNLANNRVYHGEIAAAESLYQSVLTRIPHHAQAHWSLAAARKATDHSHIEVMQKLLLQPRLEDRPRAFLHYAIGKECEDLKDWDSAIEAFMAGAKARRNTVEYDEAAEQLMFDYLIEHCTEEWLADSQGSDHSAPIFVLGQPRTGTTLIERIITSHSDVTSAGELQQFGMSLRRLNNHRDPKRFSAQMFEASMNLDFKQVGDVYMEATKRLHGGTPRFVDKLPVNYLLIPFILKAFPKAKIVHLTREPMDACFASFKQLFADAYLHSYDQAEMARHHSRYLKLMAVYRERFAGRFFDISYEATAQDIEPNARALIQYLELPWQDACLNFHQQTGAVSTASAAQVREPAHTRSIGRWKKYQQQLQPMLQALSNENIAI
ncbi:sulfotransferase [Simiduia curdlanivorans]|uniref:Tetratricopeptide repeat-containing sulfotransferase family protein n=1 Tax=Simiduia curdlanivorans TaxID=1492769 RepID=A0ABV8V797_9GAMM|nr:tetratricopeptide repeat-containing sulfotransferase family protein [Simiduia curdlanivorans]MDN3639122.1 sulfotransferase [Simiduia curdlanivorans]